jgi:uncharacterized protein YbaP (TraB family)
MLKHCLISVLLTAYSLTSQAETSVWKVSKGQETVYIGGTVHLLRSTDFPLPGEFDIAYHNSDRIFFETDMTALSDPSTQQKLAIAMIAEPGHTVDKLLTPETLEQLADAAAKRGLDLNALMPFKASMIMMILEVSELQRMGLTVEGVDAYFNERAIQDAMPTDELETLAVQLEFLSRMGEGNEEEFVQLSLRDLDKLEGLYDEIILAWRNGDRKQLGALFISDMKQDFPEVYGQLLAQRNSNWLPIIHNMFEEPGTEYVLVGAAHLIGPDGLLQRLEKQGYEVAQVRN